MAHGPLEAVSIGEIITTARTLAVLAVDICGVAGARRLRGSPGDDPLPDRFRTCRQDRARQRGRGECVARRAGERCRPGPGQRASVVVEVTHVVPGDQERFDLEGDLLRITGPEVADPTASSTRFSRVRIQPPMTSAISSWITPVRVSNSLATVTKRSPPGNTAAST